MDKQQAKSAVVKEITAFVKEFEGLCQKHGVLAMAVGLGVRKDCEGFQLNAGFVATEMPRLDCRQAGIFRNTLIQAAEQGAKILANQKCVCKDEHEKPAESGEVTVGKDEKQDAELQPLKEFVDEGSPESKMLVDSILQHFGLSREEFEEFRKNFGAAKWKKAKADIRATGAGGSSIGIDPAIEEEPKADPRTYFLRYGPLATKEDQGRPIRVTPEQVSTWMKSHDANERLQIVDAVSGKTVFE